MFSNFIYFIIVLLIYSTYQPAADTNFTALETLFLFFSLIVIFTWITWVQFQRIVKQISTESFAKPVCNGYRTLFAGYLWTEP